MWKLYVGKVKFVLYYPRSRKESIFCLLPTGVPFKPLAHIFKGDFLVAHKLNTDPASCESEPKPVFKACAVSFYIRWHRTHLKTADPMQSLCHRLVTRNLLVCHISPVKTVAPWVKAKHFFIKIAFTKAHKKPCFLSTCRRLSAVTPRRYAVPLKRKVCI